MIGMELRTPRKAIVAYALARLLGASAFAADTAGNPTVSSDEFRRGFERVERSIDRHVEIRPIHSDGLSTGLVVAFGHPIAPPYKLWFEGNKLIVNGVVIHPSPVKQREASAAQKPPSTEDVAFAKKLNLMMDGAQSLYLKLSPNSAQSEVERKLLDYLSKQDFVANAVWSSKMSIDVTVRQAGQEAFHLTITLSKSTPAGISKGEIKANEKRLQHRHLASLEDQLRRGECIFFSSDDGESDCSVYRNNSQFRRKIRQIMNDATLSDDGRLDRIRKVLGGNLVPALDVISNYSDTEWSLDSP